MKNEMKYLVLLYQAGVGIIGFDNIYCMDHVQAVKIAMNEAFKMFPAGKFGLHGYEVSDEEGNRVLTERLPKYIGKI
jgi:hypothetical protein